MKKKFKLSICSVVRDEAPFINEWLETHLALGVEHFYLFDLGSDDEGLASIETRYHEDLVTVLNPPRRGNFQEVQKSCYNYCLERFGRRSEWIAFIDIDEFLFDPSGASLHDCLTSLKQIPAVFVFWVPFGSSGNETTPLSGVVRGLTRRSAVIENPELEHQWYLRLKRLSGGRFTGEPINGKSVVQPHIIKEMDIHRPSSSFIKHLRTAKGGPVGQSVQSKLNTSPSWDILRINHYWARSVQALNDKATNRNLWSLDDDAREALAQWDQRISVVEDTALVNVLDKHSHGRALPTHQPY